MNILHPADAVLLPGPSNMPECQPLPVVKTDDAMVSFWQPNAYELEALQRGGSIFLRIYGRVHPVVSLGIDEYPATLANEPYDKQLDHAARNSDQWSENPVQEAFKAGARWQAARPTEMKFTTLNWHNPPGHDNVFVAHDDITLQVMAISEHDGKAYYGPVPDPEFLTDKTIDELKEAFQKRRDTRLMSAIEFGLSA